MSDVEELQAEELALLEEEKHMLEGDLEHAYATIERLTAERDALADKLAEGVALIEGDLTGAKWKAACHAFVQTARAALAQIKGGGE